MALDSPLIYITLFFLIMSRLEPVNDEGKEGLRQAHANGPFRFIRRKVCMLADGIFCIQFKILKIQTTYDTM